jgi:hypothetical protein
MAHGPYRSLFRRSSAILVVVLLNTLVACGRSDQDSSMSAASTLTQVATATSFDYPAPNMPAPLASTMPAEATAISSDYPAPNIPSSPSTTSTSYPFPTTEAYPQPVDPTPATPVPSVVPDASQSTQQPTASIILSDGLDLGMYSAAIDQFFRDELSTSRFQSDQLSQTVVYIEPTFTDAPQQSISQPIIDRVIANAGKLGLAYVASERPGGLVISITTPQMQPEASHAWQRSADDLPELAYQRRYVHWQ